MVILTRYSISDFPFSEPLSEWWAILSFSYIHPDEVARVVAASWLILAVSGRWRREADWIDRAGCILGAMIIGSIPIALIFDALSK